MDKTETALKHGDPMDCPTCGAPGQLDTDLTTKIPAFENSVWFNPHDNQGWECVDCCLK